MTLNGYFVLKTVFGSASNGLVYQGSGMVKNHDFFSKYIRYMSETYKSELLCKILLHTVC